MVFSGLKTYIKFLSRHKLYTFVSVVGFAISLTFVIILSIYAKTEVSMDTFHEKKDRIYVLVTDNERAGSFFVVGEYIKDLLPEVEDFTRVVTRKGSIGLSQEEWVSGRIMIADPGFFNIFSFPLLQGNPDHVLAAESSAVISRSMAANLFGSEDPMGKTVMVDGKEAVVSGVMEDFPYNTHMAPPDIIIHYSRVADYWGEWVLTAWNNSAFTIYFLAGENADLPSKAPVVVEKFMEVNWAFTRGYSKEVSFFPLEDIYFSGIMYGSLEVKQGSLNTTRMYFGIALLILIISVLNYVNMTVAQAGFRGKEAAVKKLMGSGRGRIIGQLLLESFVMTAFALLLAVLLSLITEPYFNRILNTTLGLKEHFNTGTVLLAFGALLILSVSAGILPALAVSSFKPIEVVKGTISRKVKAGYSKVLIVFQFTVCTALLIATFLMREQAAFMAGYDIGFNKENILMLSNTSDHNRAQWDATRSRLMQIPGVEAVGLAAGTPLDGGNNHSYEIDDQPVSMQVLSGDSVYFNIFGLTVEPTAGATYAGELQRVYLNEAAFNAVHPDPVSLEFKGFDRYVVAGIIDNIHISSLHEAVGPTMFQFLDPERWGVWDYVVKLSSDNVYLTAEQVHEAYSDMRGGAQFDWYFADERIYNWYENERRMSAVMGTFTVLSIVIMVMGVFAMSLYMIRQKEKEIGVRKVNGATVGQVLGMLNLQSLARVAIAFVIACPVAWYGMNRWLQDFPYRINIGVWAFLLAGMIVTILCLVSVSWQTFRAARANPVVSLKSE